MPRLTAEQFVERWIGRYQRGADAREEVYNVLFGAVESYPPAELFRAIPGEFQCEIMARCADASDDPDDYHVVLLVHLGPQATEADYEAANRRASRRHFALTHKWRRFFIDEEIDGFKIDDAGG